MDRVIKKSTGVLRDFCRAAEPMVTEIIGSLGPEARAALDESVEAGKIIGASIRIDVDFESAAPAVVYELIDLNGDRHHVQTRLAISEKL